MTFPSFFLLINLEEEAAAASLQPNMAISNSPDWSLATGAIKCTKRNSLQLIPNSFHYPLLSFLFTNLNLPSVRLNSSSCSSPPVLENESPPPTTKTPQEAPVLELALELQDFRFPEDSKEINVLICSLFKDPQTQGLAYDYFQKAKAKSDFAPKKYTMKLLMRYLIRSKNWASLFALSDDLKRFRVFPDVASCCRLISTCIKARKFKLVNSFLDVFLDSDKETAVNMFDSALKGYNQLHMYSSTITLYQKMKSLGIDLDIACYCRVMEAYLKSGNCEKVVDIFQEFGNRKLIKSEQPSKIHSQVYLIVCEALGRMGRPQEALVHFRDMSNHGIPQDHSVYSSLISSFASIGEVKIAEELMEEAERKSMLRDPALFMKLVSRYVKEGLLEKTLSVVQVMRRVKVRVSDCILCAIVNGFSKKRGLSDAAKVYENLVSQQCEPGQVTYASILNIYFRLGLYPKAENVFAEMESKGFGSCVVAYSTMVSAYSKMGRVSDAMKLVAKMKEKGCEPNVWTYNSLLDMHGKVLNLRFMEKTWKEMKRRKILPDKISYTTVIGAYNEGGEYEMCVKCYREYKLNGGTVDQAMGGIMVAVFSKTNRVNELVELLQDMKMQGAKLDFRFYRSAVSALRDEGLEMQVRWLEESFKYS